MPKFERLEPIANSIPSARENPYPVLQVSRDGILQYANPASLALFEGREDATGDRVPHLWRRAIATSIDTETTQTFEVPIKHRCFEFTVVPSSSDTANLYGVEITQRHRAELALQTANEQLQLMVQQRTARLKNSDRELQLQLWEQLSLQKHLHERERQLDAIFREAAIGIALLDVRGNIVRSNPALQRMLGESDVTFSEKSFRESIASGEWEDAVNEALTRDNSLPKKLELRYRHRNGSTFWGTLTLSAIYDESDRVQYLLAMVEDITDSKLARDALQLTQFAIDRAADAALWISPSGTFVYANEAACDGLGYPQTQLLTMQFYEIAPDFDPRDWSSFWDSIRTSKTFAFETRMQRCDGEIFPVDLSLNYIEFNSRQYICAFVRDITERKQAEEALRTAQERSERLLLNIFPKAIAKDLKQRINEYRQVGAAIAQRFEDVTVLFADIVGFTQLCANSPPSELVRMLNEIFSAFDRLTQERGLEKIKTIGDAYMVVGGLPERRDDHAEAVAELALAMTNEVSRFSAHTGEPIILRVGIHTGPVVAGVIGLNKFSYDLWGDTVNLASRMESQGIPGCIQVTRVTYERLRHRYVFEKRGKLFVKGRGDTIAYLLKERRRS
ncbi:adenylate/guanylate cyclase domain-containing protein [Baaleninema simplex]|uniref:adenylate/guanylate cyclase domain-containing protein n=1 Tax=Baaleninema simplex TaxID=2862350 RepID=UPI0003452AC1|nr:adenylate/guanylate cyclase domain-containing protein [Baaleninema simplex]